MASAVILDTPCGRQLVARSEAAKKLGIDRHRLGHLADAGLIKQVADGGKKKIPREEVARLAAQGIPREPGKVGRPRKPLPQVEDEIRKLPLPGRG